MNKFFIWLASILGTILIIVVAGVVIYNNSPEFKNWVNGLKDKIEKPKDDKSKEDETNKDNKEEVAGATVMFENNQLIVVIS